MEVISSLKIGPNDGGLKIGPNDQTLGPDDRT
jgi:hypothetical protein